MPLVLYSIANENAYCLLEFFVVHEQCHGYRVVDICKDKTSSLASDPLENSVCHANIVTICCVVIIKQPVRTAVYYICIYLLTDYVLTLSG